MELDTHKKNIPLLADDDGYTEVDSISTIDRLKCVSYKDTYIKKSIFKKDRIYCYDRVKIVQDNGYIIPPQFLNHKDGKTYLSGDYISVLLLDSLKILKDENKHLKDLLLKLQTRVSILEKSEKTRAKYFH